jgi:response regulator RpfG family c-di-GMP phosphodiesterase
MKPVILCVDDEPGILSSLERCLAFDDYEVIQAPDGPAALQALEQRGGQVSLLIVDQRMPMMTGDELLARVHERYGPIKAIMLSGCTDLQGLAGIVKERRVAHLIQKPWDNKELLRIVRSAVFP